MDDPESDVLFLTADPIRFEDKVTDGKVVSVLVENQIEEHNYVKLSRAQTLYVNVYNAAFDDTAMRLLNLPVPNMSVKVSFLKNKHLDVLKSNDALQTLSLHMHGSENVDVSKVSSKLTKINFNLSPTFGIQHLSACGNLTHVSIMTRDVLNYNLIQDLPASITHFKFYPSHNANDEVFENCLGTEHSTNISKFVNLVYLWLDVDQSKERFLKSALSHAPTTLLHLYVNGLRRVDDEFLKFQQLQSIYLYTRRPTFNKRKYPRSLRSFECYSGTLMTEGNVNSLVDFMRSRNVREWHVRVSGQGFTDEQKRDFTVLIARTCFQKGIRFENCEFRFVDRLMLERAFNVVAMVSVPRVRQPTLPLWRLLLRQDGDHAIMWRVIELLGLMHIFRPRP